ncbi:hypothetical protein DAEQUDRAFT_713656 [Daedalea quercina L-15889]|uniref:Uncharacterized protein n=1 Tax=Daedalea quercina L-15889 TaxID=1314783 RepID=A0A165NUE4_9APHY|nr:hypothetical protein DAEQUDRAFT_713656 [Daedalea quercina L-15889]
MPNRHGYVNDEKTFGSTTDSFPPAFLIGSHTLTQPLVSIEYAKAHLSLLGAFSSLSKRVETCLPEDLPEIAQHLDYTPQTPRRWTWFVCLAAERFHRWAKVVTANQDVESWVMAQVPPLDVLMIWHAYMLNPAWYAEDCLRLPVLQTLHTLNDRLIPAVIVMGDPVRYQPSEERKRTWLAETGTPFDPIEALKHLPHHDVICPKCEKPNAAPYLTSEGTGYAQQGFKLTCSRCSLTIDKSALAMDKLAQDLVKDHNSDKAKLDAYLPGTLRSPTDQVYTKRATTIKERIIQSDHKFRRSKEASQEDWKRKIKEDFGYSIANVHIFLRSIAGPRHLGLLQRMLDRVLSAYTDDSPFSIDLVGAVIRQGSFTSKMHAFGWTAPGYFDKAIDEIVLAHAITRYHAFLDLMAPSPASFFVPTLDIDLVWHTHQLTAGRYADDCMKFVERYIDHDDKVEENHLANAFDITCKVWQQRFKVPYSYCGCPLPGDTIGDKLQRLTRKLVASKEQGSSLRPPAHPDIPPATHASEHNAVQALRNGALSSRQTAKLHHQRRQRQKKTQERRERDARRVRRGELDPEQYRLGEMHYPAFLTPVPFPQLGLPLGGCVPVNQTTCASAPGGSCSAGGCASWGSACGGGGGGGGGGCGSASVCGGSGGGSACGGGGGGCGGGGGGCGGGGGGGGSGCGGC